MRVTIATSVGSAPVFSAELPDRLVLGRQDAKANEPPPILVRESAAAGGAPKLIFAASHDKSVSRKQLSLEQQADGALRVKNISSDVTVLLHSHGSLRPGQEQSLRPPLAISVANFEIRIAGDSADVQYEMLEMATMPPGKRLGSPSQQHSMSGTEMPSLVSSIQGKDYTQLLQQLEAIVRALQQTAAASDFLQHVAVTAEEAVELDTALVLLRVGESWNVAAKTGRDPDLVMAWQPAAALLASMAEGRRTLYRNPPASDSSPSNAQRIVSMVAAPILDDRAEVIGALYGHRQAPSPRVGRVDAKLVEILATGAATALHRMEQEAVAIKAKVLFEQFVTPRVAKHINDEKQVLSGRETDASLLFCDICGFSRVTERLGPEQTIAWLNDVLEELSQCVLNEEGTLVDYVGDELFAMFGAPLAQADHAARACRAAINMVAALPRLNAKWRPHLKEDMDLGIGVNSGRVLVGNVGSATKLKYGAHGVHVNIGSRVQSATRYLRSRILVTEAAASGLDASFSRRRIGQVRVQNLEQPISLYELQGRLPQGWAELQPHYEAALAAWEAGDVETTLRGLSRLAADHPHDGPTMALLARAMDAWRSRREADVVWQLPGK